MKANLEAFLKERLSKLKRQLTCDQLIIENPIDIFYLIGIKLSLGTLVIEKRKAALYVDGRYIEMCKKKSPVPVRPLEKLEKHSWGKKVGFDATQTMYSRFTLLKKMTKGSKLTGVHAPVAPLRAVKDQGEIRAMRKSTLLLKRGLKHVKGVLEEGMTEEDVAYEFEAFCREHGAEALSFDPIVAFGEHGAYPHYATGKGKFAPHHAVLIDAGVVVDNYCSDMTRVFLSDKGKPKIKEIYTVVKKAQKAAIKKCFVGTPLKDIDKAARDVIDKAGYGKAFSHGLGHSLGLEVHENPRLNPEATGKLEEGMVITIEPGIYLPGIGGVRYEDMVHVTKQGPVVL